MGSIESYCASSCRSAAEGNPMTLAGVISELHLKLEDIDRAILALEGLAVKNTDAQRRPTRKALPRQARKAQANPARTGKLLLVRSAIKGPSAA